jgi:hypothetical protein
MQDQDTPKIHAATRAAYPDDPDQRPYWWASLDGETWVEVDSDPREAAPAQVEALIRDYYYAHACGEGAQKDVRVNVRRLAGEGLQLLVKTNPDGSRTGHIVIARRYLRQTGTTIFGAR